MCCYYRYCVLHNKKKKWNLQGRGSELMGYSWLGNEVRESLWSVTLGRLWLLGGHWGPLPLSSKVREGGGSRSSGKFRPRWALTVFTTWATATFHCLETIRQLIIFLGACVVCSFPDFIRSLGLAGYCQTSWIQPCISRHFLQSSCCQCVVRDLWFGGKFNNKPRLKADVVKEAWDEKSVRIVLYQG